MMEMVINLSLLGFLVLTALAIVHTSDLFVSTLLAGIYGLLCASLFVVLGAMDVAFTEAAVGTGISTLLLLTTLGLAGRYERRGVRRIAAALVIVPAAGVLLLLGILDLPAFGSETAPAHTHVAARYLGLALEETGVRNVVTAILASYRGFDTFGELIVIFTAGVGVLGLLDGSPFGADRKPSAPMHHHLVLRIVARALIPVIMIFALYVQFHGDFGPGGGFQAGVIFAAAVILHIMLFGQGPGDPGNNLALRILASVGVLLFALVGVVGMLRGAAFLDYDALAARSLDGQHAGILLVELGVGITVAAVMILIFSSFSARIGQPEKEQG